MPLVIHNTTEISPEWLTAVLRRSGTLRTGAVRGCQARTGQATWSHNAIILPEYTPGASGDLPLTLFLKLVNATAFVATSEVHYFTRDYVDLPNAPIPCCYDAQVDLDSGAYHILMEDLSATHRNNHGVPPTGSYGIHLAWALAALHDHRWGEARWQGFDGALPTGDVIERYVAAARPGLEPLLADVQGEIPTEWETALRQTFEHHPRLMLERTHDPVGFTLIHGDPNPGNILSPREGEGKVYLVDRQPFDWSLTTWLGVSDLAYAIIPWWDTETRRRWEMPILREYYSQLTRRGVKDYGWEQLMLDYRLSVVQTLYIPTEWCSTEEGRTKMRWVWRPELDRIMTAFFDLRCAELWAA